MREETQKKPTICVFCKKPITKEQRPSVQIRPGKEAHMECYAQHQKNATMRGRPLTTAVLIAAQSDH